MNSSGAASRRAGLALRLAGTMLTIALLIYLLSQQGWQEIGQAFRQIPPGQLLLALGFMLLSRCFVAARWHALLRTADTKITYMQSLQITLAGLFATNFLPTTIGGDVVRLAGALRLNLDAAVSAASLVVDRLVGMAGMAMVVPFGIPSFLNANPSQSQIQELPQIQATLAWLPWGQKIWQKGITVVKRLTEAAATWLKHPRSLLVALLFSWAHMLCFFSVMWLLLDGVGERLSYWVVGGLYSLIYFISLLPFSINGYGLQEVSMTFVFSKFGGASLSSGLTVAILFRTLTMLASLPGAWFLPGLLEKKPKPERNL